MTIAKEQIIQAYLSRHATKVFDSNKKISEADFQFILETGRLSPSAFGFEPWKFLVIQNAELREKLKSFAWGAQGQLPTASHFVIILARKKPDMLYNSSYIYNTMKEVHHLPEDAIKIRTGYYEAFQKEDFNMLENDRYMFDWVARQTYIPLGNMMTSAAMIGIDSCPIEGFHPEKAEKLLEAEGLIDSNQFGVSVMVGFGYRVTEPREKTRQPIEAIVEWIH